ncbi:hypothetical protein PORCRE_797 [Porphyromonas crevioricanis JCM 15906]|uniref:Uncharacterized protein n=1 Tax=Porphyromonas crevioricanis JCM 15906 TaxID=1305617 RepID=T1DS25_9PORP|nr:hypothetical protein PORCRE_797 [Porphyromonas crevioricanis JCM 15906]
MLLFFVECITSEGQKAEGRSFHKKDYLCGVNMRIVCTKQYFASSWYLPL